MAARTRFLVFAAAWMMALSSGAAWAAAEETNSPLIRAESLGAAGYDTLVAGLQAKIDRADASDQGWLQTLWTWICYVLHDVLHDPRLVEYVKVEYWTTTASGARIPVTGLAILPQYNFLHETVPMIAFQHPTQIERRYSPSLFNMTNMWDDAQFNVAFATLYAQSGFAVVLADYPGMGVNTNAHPYCTESLANCVVDLVRAVRDLLQAHPDAYARWDSRLYLTGYSEGGYATVMAARDLQTRYAGEFTNVLGVAGLDGPYSLSVTMREVMLHADTSFNSPYFLPYTVNGYDSVYAALDPVFVFTNGVKYSVPAETNFALKLQRMCLAGTNTADEMNALIYKATPYVGPRSILSDTYIAQLSNTASVLNRVLASNDAYFAWTPQMKLRLYHNPHDDLVPYGNSTNAYNAFKGRSAPHAELCDFGNDWPLNWLIDWLKTMMGSYHAASAPVAYVYSILWLHDLAYGWGQTNQFPPNDADGDGISDYVLYDESSGIWQFLLSNRTRSWRKANPDPAACLEAQIVLGGPGFSPFLQDFDGDGKADPGVYQAATGIWTVWLSLVDYLPIVFPLGGTDSIPMPQDYDGNRLAEPCVYDRASGQWIIFLVSSNRLVTVELGGPECLPVEGDYDGDRKADPAVYRESDGQWGVMLSGNGYALATAPCGGPGCAPAPGDYDGDGKTDPAVYREATGDWRILLSAGGYRQADLNFGGPDYLPAAGDYDGDDKADIMVYHAGSGLWAGRMSASGYDTVSGYFGGPGHRPVP